SGLRLKRLKVDGGATANAFLMQEQADVLSREVAVSPAREATALGAAALAALGSGLATSKDLSRALGRGGRVFRPKISRQRAGEKLIRFRRAVAAARSFAS